MGNADKRISEIYLFYYMHQNKVYTSHAVRLITCIRIRSCIHHISSQVNSMLYQVSISHPEQQVERVQQTSQTPHRVLPSHPDRSSSVLLI